MARKSEPVYVISVAARLGGVHPQTLRIYERRGLLDPYRTPGGTRRYSEEDLDRLALIQELTEQGLNLEGVKKVIDLQDQISRLERKVDKLQATLEAVQRQAEAEVHRVHQSYRREIILQRRVLPDIVRRQERPR